jgi:DNA-binding transcriptional LysR family regulator
MNNPGLARDFWELRSSQGKVAHFRFPGNGVSANSFTAIQSLVVFGDGIALMPRALCKQDLLAKKVVRVLPEWATAEMPIYLVYPAQRYSSSKLKEFIPLFEERARAVLC